MPIENRGIHPKYENIPGDGNEIKRKRMPGRDNPIPKRNKIDKVQDEAISSFKKRTVSESPTPPIKQRSAKKVEDPSFKVSGSIAEPSLKRKTKSREQPGKRSKLEKGDHDIEELVGKTKHLNISGGSSESDTESADSEIENLMDLEELDDLTERLELSDESSDDTMDISDFDMEDRMEIEELSDLADDLMELCEFEHTDDHLQSLIDHFAGYPSDDFSHFSDGSSHSPSPQWQVPWYDAPHTINYLNNVNPSLYPLEPVMLPDWGKDGMVVGSFHFAQETPVENAPKENVASSEKPEQNAAQDSGFVKHKKHRPDERAHKNRENVVRPKETPIYYEDIHPQFVLVRELITSGKYVNAIALLSKMYVTNPNHLELLVLMGDCFTKANRSAEALEMYQKAAHRAPKDLKIKEKIADCLSTQHQYLKANLIYSILLKKVGRAQRKALSEKILKNNQFLRSMEQWPDFNHLMKDVGIDSGKTVSAAELDSIAKFLRETNPRAFLMWDIEMDKLKKASIASLEKDASVLKHPVYLPNGALMTDSQGNVIHLYEAPKMPLLAHFTMPANALKVLDSLENDKTLGPGDEQRDSFWNNQYKVCCSMVQPGSKSFFNVAFKTSGVGLVAYVPDPVWNIIHTWGDDTYTPTNTEAKDVAAVTGQTGAESVMRYNEFMIRFQPIASYVYAVFQQADRLQQQVELRKQFEELQKDIQGRLTGINIIDSLFRKVTGYFSSFLDPARGKLDPILTEIEAFVRTHDLGNTTIQDKVTAQLKAIRRTLKDEGESKRAEKVTERIHEIFSDMTRALPVREGGAATRVAKYKDKGINKPLIALYLEETIKLSSTLLKQGVSEEVLFTTLFRRPPDKGETVVETLRKIDKELDALYHMNKQVLYKRVLQENVIWTRALSPKELLDSVKEGRYSEIGVRGHKASDQVHSNHARFAGLVLEKETTFVKHANGWQIKAEDPEKLHQIIDVIKKGTGAKLPCFLI